MSGRMKDSDFERPGLDDLLVYQRVNWERVHLDRVMQWILKAVSIEGVDVNRNFRKKLTEFRKSRNVIKVGVGEENSREFKVMARKGF